MDENKIKFELKEDKIIDILLHSATREDINKLEAKIDDKASRDDFNKLEAKIDANAKVSQDNFNKLDAKIDDKASRDDFNKLEARIDKLDAKFDKLTWFIIVGILIPIVLHFIK